MSISYADPSIASLRSLVEVVDRELATTALSPALRDAWAQMVKVLALGPAPDLRACPACGELGMRAATRCSRCWASLQPEKE